MAEVPAPPDCAYFTAGRCRSCVHIEQPIDAQLRAKEERCRDLLGAAVPDTAWLPSVGGGVRDFRNKAKLVVGGAPGEVTLGILGPDGAGVDLRDCLIQEPAIRDAIPRIAAFLNDTELPPYRVPERKGELKFAHVTAAPSGQLMLRFVVRTEQAFHVIRKRLADLRAALPEAAVITVNLLPEHKAVLEGAREERLLGSSLTMPLRVPGADAVSLNLLPQSFFQTNTPVAQALYAQAADWVDAARPASLWDLYCGVGGFALHCAAPDRRVLGVEIAPAAVESAERSAREAGVAAAFLAADATAFARTADPAQLPDAVIVNPPRRGIGAELASWLEAAPIDTVVYSSCNPTTLARDLAAMPSLAVRGARVFDMFPHTGHLEVMVRLQRRR